MSIAYQKHEKKITIGSTIVLLPAPLRQVYEQDNKIVVVLDPAYGMENVFCYDPQGQKLWTIQKTDYFKHGDEGYSMIGRDPTASDGKLVAISRGRPFLLDIETGKTTFIEGDFER